MKDLMSRTFESARKLILREVVILWGAQKLNARKKGARILKLREN